jgi:hypothetical protein
VGLHSGKGDVDDVGQLGLVRWGSAISEREDVVKLSKGVDSNRDESSLEVVAVLLHQFLARIFLHSTRVERDRLTQKSIQAAIQVLPRAYQGAYLNVPFST